MMPFNQMLVERYLGFEMFHKMHPETRKIIILDLEKKFKQEIISRYGSEYNYHKHLIKLKGFNSESEYMLYIANNNGFDTIKEYRDSLAKKNGFESVGKRGWDWDKKRARKLGFKNPSQMKLVAIKKRGFKNYAEYRKYLSSQIQSNKSEEKDAK